MVNIIVNEIVTQLALLPFVDKITGIVKTAHVDVAGVVKTIPVALNTDVSVCNPNVLEDFIPSDKKVSIIYFEDRGTTLTGMENQWLAFTSNFTLVCWFNYKKIAGCLTNTSQIVGNLIKYLPDNMHNVGTLIGVYLTVEGQQSNDGAVFGKYSYLEEVSQYITYPYGYVALDLSAEYKVRKQCFDDLEICTPIC